MTLSKIRPLPAKLSSDGVETHVAPHAESIHAGSLSIVTTTSPPGRGTVSPPERAAGASIMGVRSGGDSITEIVQIAILSTMVHAGLPHPH